MINKYTSFDQVPDSIQKDLERVCANSLDGNLFIVDINALVKEISGGKASIYPKMTGRVQGMNPLEYATFERAPIYLVSWLASYRGPTVATSFICERVEGTIPASWGLLYGGFGMGYRQLGLHPDILAMLDAKSDEELGKLTLVDANHTYGGNNLEETIAKRKEYLDFIRPYLVTRGGTTVFQGVRMDRQSDDTLRSQVASLKDWTFQTGLDDKTYKFLAEFPVRQATATEDTTPAGVPDFGAMEKLPPVEIVPVVPAGVIEG